MEIINNKRVNVSNGETITVKENKGEIIVDSDLYNNNKAYSEHIDNTLTSVFKAIGQSY